MITQKPPQRQPQTPQEIDEYTCPTCGGVTMVRYHHVGGHASDQPFIVCESHACAEYFLVRLSERAAYLYNLWLQDRELAFEIYREETDER